MGKFWMKNNTKIKSTIHRDENVILKNENMILKRLHRQGTRDLQASCRASLRTTWAAWLQERRIVAFRDLLLRKEKTREKLELTTKNHMSEA